MTLLHHAAENGFDDAVKYLVETGTNTRIKNEDGHTPLELALMSPSADTSFISRNTSYNCYATNDKQFGSCNTSSYDEIARYLIWWERTHFAKCDARSASLLKTIIEKQMPLSLYELFKAGVDMNCRKDKSVPRPFLKNLQLKGRQLSEVFKIFEVDISLECGTFLTTSELHLISYLSPDQIGNFFEPSLNKRRSPLQRLIDKHPDGVGILDKCYDDRGYLPIHHTAFGGNPAAIKWFKSIGVNTQLKTRGGLTALEISILHLGNISEAELITPASESTQYAASSYRKEVFEELLRTCFTIAPEYRSDFLCSPGLERRSPLLFAANKGMAVLKYVHRKASEIFPNLPLNCGNRHRVDTAYLVYLCETYYT